MFVLYCELMGTQYKLYISRFGLHLTSGMNGRKWIVIFYDGLGLVSVESQWRSELLIKLINKNTIKYLKNYNYLFSLNCSAIL